MVLEQAVRISEMMLAFALVIQSAEYIRGLPFEKYCGFVSLVLSLLLFAGVETVFVEASLLFIAVVLLYRFQGPYNGGSDCMTLLVLLCLFLSHLVPTRFWQEIVLGYLAFQVVFSYFQSGYIKIINADWRSGQALSDVFSLTAYPVSQSIRSWAKSSRLIIAMSWVVIVFELLFPFSLLYQPLLIVSLFVAITFHFANAWLFGLNRFFWIWPAAYPILFWFQSRVILPLLN